MHRKAIRYKGEIFSDLAWHYDAISEARRWFKEETLDESLLEFGYLTEDHEWIDMHYRENT